MKEKVNLYQKGITLVALVVTIVVLLILAGITITYVLGDNGIIKKAQEAKNKMEEAIANESNELKELSKLLEETYEPGRTLTINFRNAKTWNYLLTNETSELKIGIYKDEGCSDLFKTISTKDGMCKLTGSDVPSKGTYYIKTINVPVGYETQKIRKAEILGVKDEVWEYIFANSSLLGDDPFSAGEMNSWENGIYILWDDEGNEVKRPASLKLRGYDSPSSFKDFIIDNNCIWSNHNTSFSIWKYSTDDWNWQTECFIQLPYIHNYEVRFGYYADNEKKLFIYCTYKFAGDYNVKVVWDNTVTESNRPTEVTIALLRDDMVYETVALSKANNWFYSWDDLDPNYNWTVIVSDSLSSYNETVTMEGDTTIITYSYKSEENPPENPPDNSSPADAPPDA